MTTQTKIDKYVLKSKCSREKDRQENENVRTEICKFQFQLFKEYKITFEEFLEFTNVRELVQISLRRKRPKDAELFMKHTDTYANKVYNSCLIDPNYLSKTTTFLKLQCKKKPWLTKSDLKLIYKFNIKKVHVDGSINNALNGENDILHLWNKISQYYNYKLNPEQNLYYINKKLKKYKLCCLKHNFLYKLQKIHVKQTMGPCEDSIIKLIMDLEGKYVEKCPCKVDPLEENKKKPGPKSKTLRKQDIINLENLKVSGCPNFVKNSDQNFISAEVKKKPGPKSKTTKVKKQAININIHSKNFNEQNAKATEKNIANIPDNELKVIKKKPGPKSRTVESEIKTCNYKKLETVNLNQDVIFSSKMNRENKNIMVEINNEHLHQISKTCLIEAKLKHAHKVKDNDNLNTLEKIGNIDQRAHSVEKNNIFFDNKKLLDLEDKNIDHENVKKNNFKKVSSNNISVEIDVVKPNNNKEKMEIAHATENMKECSINLNERINDNNQNSQHESSEVNSIPNDKIREKDNSSTSNENKELANKISLKSLNFEQFGRELIGDSCLIIKKYYKLFKQHNMTLDSHELNCKIIAKCEKRLKEKKNQKEMFSEKKRIFQMSLDDFKNKTNIAELIYEKRKPRVGKRIALLDLDIRIESLYYSYIKNSIWISKLKLDDSLKTIPTQNTIEHEIESSNKLIHDQNAEDEQTREKTRTDKLITEQYNTSIPQLFNKSSTNIMEKEIGKKNIPTSNIKEDKKLSFVSNNYTKKDLSSIETEKEIEKETETVFGDAVTSHENENLDVHEALNHSNKINQNNSLNLEKVSIKKEHDIQFSTYIEDALALSPESKKTIIIEDDETGDVNKMLKEINQKPPSWRPNSIKSNAPSSKQLPDVGQNINKANSTVIDILANEKSNNSEKSTGILKSASKINEEKDVLFANKTCSVLTSDESSKSYDFGCKSTPYFTEETLQVNKVNKKRKLLVLPNRFSKENKSDSGSPVEPQIPINSIAATELTQKREWAKKIMSDALGNESNDSLSNNYTNNDSSSIVSGPPDAFRYDSDTEKQIEKEIQTLLGDTVTSNENKDLNVHEALNHSNKINQNSSLNLEETSIKKEHDTQYSIYIDDVLALSPEKNKTIVIEDDETEDVQKMLQEIMSGHPNSSKSNSPSSTQLPDVGQNINRASSTVIDILANEKSNNSEKSSGVSKSVSKISEEKDVLFANKTCSLLTSEQSSDSYDFGCKSAPYFTEETSQVNKVNRKRKLLALPNRFSKENKSDSDSSVELQKSINSIAPTKLKQRSEWAKKIMQDALRNESCDSLSHTTERHFIPICPSPVYFQSHQLFSDQNLIGFEFNKSPDLFISSEENSKMSKNTAFQEPQVCEILSQPTNAIDPLIINETQMENKNSNELINEIMSSFFKPKDMEERTEKSPLIKALQSVEINELSHKNNSVANESLIKFGGRSFLFTDKLQKIIQKRSERKKSIFSTKRKKINKKKTNLNTKKLLKQFNPNESFALQERHTFPRLQIVLNRANEPPKVIEGQNFSPKHSENNLKNLNEHNYSRKDTSILTNSELLNTDITYFNSSLLSSQKMHEILLDKNQNGISSSYLSNRKTDTKVKWMQHEDQNFKNGKRKLPIDFYESKLKRIRLDSESVLNNNSIMCNINGNLENIQIYSNNSIQISTKNCSTKIIINNVEKKKLENRLGIFLKLNQNSNIINKFTGYDSNNYHTEFHDDFENKIYQENIIPKLNSYSMQRSEIFQNCDNFNNYLSKSLKISAYPYFILTNLSINEIIFNQIQYISKLFNQKYYNPEIIIDQFLRFVIDINSTNFSHLICDNFTLKYLLNINNVIWLDLIKIFQSIKNFKFSPRSNCTSNQKAEKVLFYFFKSFPSYVLVPFRFYERANDHIYFLKSANCYKNNKNGTKKLTNVINSKTLNLMKNYRKYLESQIEK